LFWFQTDLVFAQRIRVVATFPDLADIPARSVKKWSAWRVLPRELKTRTAFR
jgi:hypothetical protein